MSETFLSFSTRDLLVFAFGFAVGFKVKFAKILAKKWLQKRRRLLEADKTGDYSKLTNAELNEILRKGEKAEQKS